jgi:hypothetical protein
MYFNLHKIASRIPHPRINLDGQWDDVIDFVQPLKTIDAFDAKQFIYIVLKYQFLELLCLKTESPVENEVSAEQIVK